jgi:hypothetical protein
VAHYHGTLLNQERLIDFLDGAGLLAYCGGNIIDTGRATFALDRLVCKVSLIIHIIEAAFIYIQCS